MMKRVFVSILIGACGALTVNAQQHKLWYDKPATHWLEALPIGNSHLGAMVYGQTDGEVIQLNEETFWSGSPHDNNSQESLEYLPEVRRLIFEGKEAEAHKLIEQHFIKGPHGMRYLPMGSLQLFGGQSFEQTSNFRRELNLGTAVCTTTYKDRLNGVTYTREVFASQADNAIIMHLKASKKGKLEFSLSHWCNTELKNNSRAENGLLTATVQNVEQEGIAGGLTAGIRALVKSDGTFDNTPQMVGVKGATEATIYITAATNYINYHDISGNPSERTQQTIASISNKSYRELLERHLKKYQEQYNRVSLSFPKSKNEALPTDQRLATFDGSICPSLASAVLSDAKARPISVGSTVPTDISANGIMRNGGNERIFDLQGRQIVNRKSANRQSVKGVYLMNGKKVVVK